MFRLGRPLRAPMLESELRGRLRRLLLEDEYGVPPKPSLTRGDAHGAVRRYVHLKANRYEGVDGGSLDATAVALLRYLPE